MAKKRVKKSVAKNSAKSPRENSKKRHMTAAGWFFVNLILLAIFLYGSYIIWTKDWVEGISIIALDLLIIFIIKLILKFKKK
ncbi:MAG: hypothetical protein QXI33_00905 [Candidatus Pacearchaeota archaeon]